MQGRFCSLGLGPAPLLRPQAVIAEAAILEGAAKAVLAGNASPLLVECM